MRGTALCLAVIVSGATLLAQTPLGQSPAADSAASQGPKLTEDAKLGESPIVLFASPGSYGCPVGLTAERYSPSTLVTASEPSAMRLSEGIQLGLEHRLAPDVEQITVVVHGLSGKSRFVPLATESSGDVEETFELAAGQ